jgi:hypothetical protein
MKQPKKDFVAIAIADYEAMTDEEKGQMIVQVLEDQPVLMGFITNLADDFSDPEHEALVDSAVILINAFVSAGIPVEMVPHQMVEEVIQERADSYEQTAEKADDLTQEDLKDVSDSPMVFEDLRNRAMFKIQEQEEEPGLNPEFILILDTVIAIIERSVSLEMNKK